MTTARFILEHCACGKVRMAARSVTRRYDEALRPTGLRASQFALLIAISVEGAISISALAKQLGMDRSTLTRNLGPMVEQGLVALGAEGWRRSRTMELTRKGAERMQEAIPLWKRAQEALRHRLGSHNWETAREGLNQLIQAE